MEDFVCLIAFDIWYKESSMIQGYFAIFLNCFYQLCALYYTN